MTTSPSMTLGRGALADGPPRSSSSFKQIQPWRRADLGLRTCTPRTWNYGARLNLSFMCIHHHKISFDGNDDFFSQERGVDCGCELPTKKTKFQRWKFNGKKVLFKESVKQTKSTFTTHLKFYREKLRLRIDLKKYFNANAGQRAQIPQRPACL